MNGRDIMALEDYSYEIGLYYDNETEKRYDLTANVVGIDDLEEYLRLIGKLDKKFLEQRIWHSEGEKSKEGYITLSIGSRNNKGGKLESIGLLNTAPTYIASKEVIDIIFDKDKW